MWDKKDHPNWIAHGRFSSKERKRFMKNIHRTHTHQLEHDLHGAQALELARELNHFPIHAMDRMVLRMNKVQHLDATGLAILVRLFSHLSARGKHLELDCLTPSIRHFLDQHGLTELFGLKQEQVSATMEPGTA
jgi:anti-anti-sigma factor